MLLYKELYKETYLISNMFTKLMIPLENESVVKECLLTTED
jgi:hypothetical protein